MINFPQMYKILTKSFGTFMDGVGMTLQLAAYTVLFGTMLGILVAVLRRVRFKPVQWLFTIYVELLRGTPLLVQALLFCYGLPILGFNPGRKMLAILALIINSSAYMSEIIRAGIQSIDHGQTEASLSLGMSRMQNMLYIVLPQAIKTTLPAMGNEFVVIIKESSVLYAVGIYELTYQAQKLASVNYYYIETMLIAALIYFTLTFTASRLLGLLERRLRRGEQGA